MASAPIGCNLSRVLALLFIRVTSELPLANSAMAFVLPLGTVSAAL